MFRKLLLPALVTALLGCQTSEVVRPAPSPPKAPAGPACYVSGDRVGSLMRMQYRYLVSDSPEQRERQLLEARTNGDKALEGLLLTSPASSGDNNVRGAELLSSLPLYPDDSCIADRYLYLYLNLVRHDLGRRAELKARNEEIAELKRKIEALTDLEQQITRQRKDL